MLILIGSVNLHKEVKAYDFQAKQCPNCHKELKIIEVTRWFTLFFIRLLKTDVLGYYYLCPVCKAEYSNSQV